MLFPGCMVHIMSLTYYSYIQDTYKEYMVFADPQTEVFPSALFRDTASFLVVAPLDSFQASDTLDTERFHDVRLLLEMFLRNGPNTP
jgi:hypothetical protein